MFPEAHVWRKKTCLQNSLVLRDNSELTVVDEATSPAGITCNERTRSLVHYQNLDVTRHQVGIPS